MEATLTFSIACVILVPGDSTIHENEMNESIENIHKVLKLF